MNIPIDVSGGVPIEVNGERLANLNKRLFPTDSNVEGSSPQRFVPLILPVKSENYSNSISTLEDNYGSPDNNNKRSFSLTPTNSRSQPYRQIESADNEDSSEAIIGDNVNDTDSRGKRPKANDGEPPVKSPKLEDPNGT